MNFRMDYSKKQVMQISNDAFYYLYYGEEPLDDENMEEAQEITDMFPNGFVIEDNWENIDDTDLIECTFVPYVKDDMDFDEYENLTKYIQLQIKWLDTNLIRAWWFYEQTGARELRGDFKVYTDKYGNRYFHTGEQDKDFVSGKMSLYFLKHFKKKGC